MYSRTCGQPEKQRSWPLTHFGKQNLDGKSENFLKQRKNIADEIPEIWSSVVWPFQMFYPFLPVSLNWCSILEQFGDFHSWNIFSRKRKFLKKKNARMSILQEISKYSHTISHHFGTKFWRFISYHLTQVRIEYVYFTDLQVLHHSKLDTIFVKLIRIW